MGASIMLLATVLGSTAAVMDRWMTTCPTAGDDTRHRHKPNEAAESRIELPCHNLEEGIGGTTRCVDPVLVVLWT